MRARVVRVVTFVGALLLAPVFVIVLLVALAGTLTLIKDGIASGGDRQAFEAHIRHYSDRIEQAPDGTLVFHQARNPAASFLGVVGASWVATLLVGYIIERLRRSLKSPAPDGAQSPSAGKRDAT